jgi:hypothetical protein
MELQRNHEQIHPSEQPSLVKSPRHKHKAQSRLRTVAVLRNPKTQHTHKKTKNKQTTKNTTVARTHSKTRQCHCRKSRRPHLPPFSANTEDTPITKHDENPCFYLQIVHSNTTTTGAFRNLKKAFHCVFHGQENLNPLFPTNNNNHPLLPREPLAVIKP